MKNNVATRYGFYALVSLFINIVCWYMAFSESWTSAGMKLFMALIIGTGALFTFFCSRGAQDLKKEQENARQQFKLAHAN